MFEDVGAEDAGVERLPKLKPVLVVAVLVPPKPPPPKPKLLVPNPAVIFFLY